MKRKKKIDTVEAWSHKHDFPIEDVWNTDNTIEAWHKIIDKMIYAFELVMHDSVLTPEQEKDFEEGFKLFYKYYRYLWD